MKHYCYNYEDKDPYWYLINKSSHFIVTEDSVSMTSDAVFTGKPVYMVKIKNKKKKIIFNVLFVRQLKYMNLILLVRKQTIRSFYVK